MNIKAPIVAFNLGLKYPGLAYLLFSVLLVPVVIAYAANETPVTDLRVIIDISGSMKKTDPDNLRQPALRLLAGMIPGGSRAGVWNFGKQVNMSVRIGEVNDAWRELARKQSKEISSVGLYTNIEEAIRRASFDWKTPDPRYKRNLILLTDGHVDISKDEKENEISKSRIIKEILPALEKAKVQIHTIALSDDVDESLLSTLSAYTNGLYKKVKSAEDLQKLFLQMLEQSTSMDSLPLRDNIFNVDASINDMTLLVFNRNKSSPTKIITPDKQNWTVKSHAASVKWFSDTGYDLITVKKPQQGSWKISAPLDENNRVVVATNLKLKITDLPGYAMPGDIINVNASLSEEGKKLTDQRLLSKFIFSIKRKLEGHGEWLYEMSSPDKNNNYSYQLPSINIEGINELVISAKSPTAEREARHQFKVYTTPASILITKAGGKYKLEVKPFENLLKPDSLNIVAILHDKTEHKLTRDEKTWSILLDEKYHGTLFDLNINGLRADGKDISMSFQRRLDSEAGNQGLELGKKKTAVTRLEKELHKTKTHDKVKEETGKTSKTEEHETGSHGKTKLHGEINWTLIIISILAGNIVLIGAFAGGYLYIKRRKNKMSAALHDEMSESDK